MGDLRALTRDTFLTLADVLEAVPPAALATPSLCEGWTVAHVVAHVTMPARYDEEGFTAGLADHQFDFTALSNSIATEDSRLPAEQLLGDLRNPALHEWTPPGGGVEGALTHVVIHALDITEPLGQPRAASDEAIAAVLDVLTVGGAHVHFDTSLEGPPLEATDIDWSYGRGTCPQRATATEHVLRLSGRTSAS